MLRLGREWVIGSFCYLLRHSNCSYVLLFEPRGARLLRGRGQIGRVIQICDYLSRAVTHVDPWISSSGRVSCYKPVLALSHHLSTFSRWVYLLHPSTLLPPLYATCTKAPKLLLIQPYSLLNFHNPYIL